MKDPGMQCNTIPVTLAQKAAENLPSRFHFTACALCRQPVELERCATDEKGSAVHEQCYIAGLDGGMGRRSRRTE